MSELRIALFDFDGTLCDSAASIIRLTSHAKSYRCAYPR